MQKLLTWFLQRKWSIVILGCSIFLLFVGFSYFVHKNIFTQFDFDMTVKLQDHIGHRFDKWFSFLSDFGTAEVVSVILLILLAIRRKLGGFFVLLFFASFHIIEVYGKTFVSHLPPPEFLLRTQHVVNFPEFHVRLQNSYPSGHAGRALFMTTILWVMTAYSKRISRTQKVFVFASLACYDVLMCVSRVYLGEHWSSDVIGGSILGFAFGLLGAVSII